MAITFEVHDSKNEPALGRGRVYVVDDDAAIRRSIEFLFASKGIQVSAFASAAAFMRALPSLPAAPILLDLRLPDRDGMDVLEDLAALGIWWPITILTGHGEIAQAVRALKLGAIDFLEKPLSPGELLISIDAAYQKLAERAEKQSGLADARSRLAKLTEREIQVIRALSQGLLNKEAACGLAISTRTVEMHRANALQKLGVRSLVEASAILSHADQL